MFKAFLNEDGVWDFFLNFHFYGFYSFLVDIFRDDKYKIIRDRGEQLKTF